MSPKADVETLTQERQLRANNGRLKYSLPTYVSHSYGLLGTTGRSGKPVEVDRYAGRRAVRRAPEEQVLAAGAGVEELGVVLPFPPLHHSDTDHTKLWVHDILAVACAPKPGLNHTLRRSVVGDVLSPVEPLAASLESNGLNALAHTIVRKPAGRRQVAAPFTCRTAEAGIPVQGTSRGLADATADGAIRAGLIGQSKNLALECACRGVLGIRRNNEYDS